MKRYFSIAVFFTLGWLWPVLAFGISEVQLVKGVYSKLIALQQTQPLIRSESVKAVQDVYDFDAFCSLTLQDVQEKLTPSQKQDFCAVFKEVFFTNMKQNGLKFAKKNLENMLVTLQKKSKTFSIVKVSGKVKETKVNITFDLIPSAASYKLIDISFEDARLSRNYRGQFNWIFRKEHYEGLMGRMKKKLDELRS